MMKTLLVSIALLSSSSVFAQAASKPLSNQQLTSSVKEIQSSLDDVKTDLKKASKLLDNKAMLGLFQRLDEVAQDVDELRGLVEEQGHLQQRLQKRQRELYLDIDRRMREMELKASAAPAQAPSNPIQIPTINPNVTSTAPNVAVAPKSEPKQVIAPKTESVPVATVEPKTVVKQPAVKQPTQPAQPMSQERKDYQSAFDLLKEGRYNKAKIAFKGFLKKYPNSSYAGNAQYWSGEANYVTRQFATAMNEFKQVITKYPSSNKVPDAMLKLGYTFYETRQMDNAKQILNELVKRFAKSTAARLAKKRLKRMKKEGF